VALDIGHENRENIEGNDLLLPKPEIGQAREWHATLIFGLTHVQPWLQPHYKSNSFSGEIILQTQL